MHEQIHLNMFGQVARRTLGPFKLQLLKWIGNKQRFAHEIISYFPEHFGTYFEPFLGSGGVLGSLAPTRAVASDVFEPLMQIWRALKDSPDELKDWYRTRWELIDPLGKEQAYEQVKGAYNSAPSGADLVFLCRSCYGGVVRFRKADGYMSTPCGVHAPIHPRSFAHRVDVWHRRVAGTEFRALPFEEALALAKHGDMVYCDPPYSHSQAILYGAQSFSLASLFEAIRECRERGVHVALSIDGLKRSGGVRCRIDIPTGLFEREVLVNCGRSMLRRFQMNGETLENEVVADRLLLTY